MIEGIFDSCDASATHLILLEAVILRVHGKDPFDQNARSELIRRAEKASVNMSEVKEVRFAGINITKDGIDVIIPKRSTLPETKAEEPEIPQ